MKLNVKKSKITQTIILAGIAILLFSLILFTTLISAQNMGDDVVQTTEDDITLTDPINADEDIVSDLEIIVGNTYQELPEGGISADEATAIGADAAYKNFGETFNGIVVASLAIYPNPDNRVTWSCTAQTDGGFYSFEVDAITGDDLSGIFYDGVEMDQETIDFYQSGEYLDIPFSEEYFGNEGNYGFDKGTGTGGVPEFAERYRGAYFVDPVIQIVEETGLNNGSPVKYAYAVNGGGSCMGYEDGDNWIQTWYLEYRIFEVALENGEYIDVYVNVENNTMHGYERHTQNYVQRYFISDWEYTPSE